MKICVVTIIDNTNYGTYLQALALSNIFQEKNNDVIILKYQRDCMRPLNIVKNRKNTMNIKQRLIILISQFMFVPLKRFCLLKETMRYVKYTQKFIGYDKLYKNVPKADLYVTGSDQVWNVNYNSGIDKVFYLDFVPSGFPKCSYASSIGMNSFPNEYKDELKYLFKSYKYISIRERESLSLFEELGIKNVKSVLDPTLLISKDKWVSLFGLKSRNNNYVLIYSVEKDRTSALINMGRNIASKLNCKLILIENGNPLLRNRKNVDKIIYSPTLKQFLELFYNAKFIIASSFHGTAFSLNFNKQFLIVQPPRFNVRINSLLKDVGLTQRAITLSDNVHSICYEELKEIDYTIINSRLKELRTYSMNQIESIIKFGNKCL